MRSKKYLFGVSLNDELLILINVKVRFMTVFFSISCLEKESKHNYVAFPRQRSKQVFILDV